MQQSRTSLHIVLTHYRFLLLVLLRMPAHLIPSLGFPAMLFLIFALPRATDPFTTGLLLANFTIFSILAIVLYQFGVGIAGERESAWEQYIRTLPVRPAERMISRILVALTFALAATLIMMLLAMILAHAVLPLKSVVLFLVAVLIGAVPFSALGIAIGYLAGPRSAVPIANLIYLPISYLGGIIASTAIIPYPLSLVTPFLPTRQYSQIVSGALLGAPIPLEAFVGIGIYLVVFCGLAIWAYKRDEGVRFA